MSDEIEKAPKIRFSGFTYDWEEHKLIEKIEKVLDYRGKSPEKFGFFWGDTGYLVLSALNVKNGCIDKSVEAKYGNQELFERWMGKERLEKGDVLFTTEAPLGNVAQVPDNNGYILNQRVVAFKTATDKLDNNFLATLLRSPLFQEKLNANSSGGTAKGIGIKEFAKIASMLPSDVAEQMKIGSFFANLDNLITLHQRKLELLKATKKSMLQKMFPEEGANEPEIRFAGFTEAWEERKFSKVLKSHSYNAYLAGPSESGNYKVIQQGDNPVVGYSNGNPFENFEDVTLFGDHTVSLYKPTEPFFVATDGVKILSGDGFDGMYLFSTLERYKPASQGYKRHFTILKNKDFWFAKNNDEQRKIGTFFAVLNNLITLQQLELDSLKNLKKSLLQQMFV